MPFQPVLDAFGGNLKTVGTGASTANQHMPHFADDVVLDSSHPLYRGVPKVYDRMGHSAQEPGQPIDIWSRKSGL